MSAQGSRISWSVDLLGHTVLDYCVAKSLSGFV